MYRQKQQEALTKWKIVHDWAEKHATGQQTEVPEDEQVRNWVIAFLDWVNTYHVEFLENERFVYSKEYNYWGKFDSIVRINWKKYLVDFKTSNDFYPMEMWMQLAAYRHAYEEETWDILDGEMIIRFSKDTGEFAVHACDEYEQDFEAFAACLVVKRRMKEVEKKQKQLV